MSDFGSRLRKARLQAKLSQEQLGIEAGLEPASASTRMNRYELGKRVPAQQIVRQLALVLKVPTAYFYSDNNDEASLLLNYHRLSKPKKQQVNELIQSLM
ncbi:helix-turn-helix domain-containing protein [Polaromonas sp.]|uniref:helix-turn-helix domain-containing protein n=1 Tax=Polaromonas sp. TaxID=1869339 RepID=UPI00352B06AA